jgi:RNA polymerase sigma-70 factor (ECF subfamily)
VSTDRADHEKTVPPREPSPQTRVYSGTMDGEPGGMTPRTSSQRAANGHEANRGQPGGGGETTGGASPRAKFFGDDAPPGGTDEALLQACTSGDQTAFRVLFERYEPLLTRFFVHLLGSQEDAEEAVVDTFVRVWRGAATFRGEASARTWLYRIAHHLALDALRRRQRRPRADVALLPGEEHDDRLAADAEATDPAAMLVAGFQREQDRRALHRALAFLSPTDRTLIGLFYFEGWSHVQISAVRGESLPRVKGLLHRARQRLKKHFLRLRNDNDNLEMLADSPADPSLDPGSLLAL